MRAVNIGIGHNDNFSVSQLCYIKVLTDRGSQRCYYRHKLLIAVNLIYPCFFNVQHLTPQRKYSLIFSFSAFLSRASRRVSLDDVDLCEFSISFGAVSKLARQGRGFKGAFSSGELSCLFSGLSCFFSLNRFIKNSFSYCRIFLKIVHKLLGNELINKGSDLGVSETSFSLTLKLTVC